MNFNSVKVNCILRSSSCVLHSVLCLVRSQYSFYSIYKGLCGVKYNELRPEEMIFRYQLFACIFRTRLFFV
jgi:hypothetical protein